MFGFVDIAQNATTYTGMPDFLSAQTLLTVPLQKLTTSNTQVKDSTYQV
jgi:hypothetical protein